MGGEGQRITLAEAADLQTGFPFKSADFTDELSDVRLVRGDNIVQGALRWDGVKRWPSSKLNNHRDYLLRPGDVVLAMDRPWIEAGLKHATLTEADCPSLLVQRVARLRARIGVNQRFLGYVIRSTDFTNYVLGVQTGTAVPHISSTQIKAYEFFLPPLKQQERVAELLGTLDDKIELNRRKAETLEAMAQTLFRSWFVDFEPVRAKVESRSTGLSSALASLFPKGFGDGGLPLGWTLQPLSGLLRNVVERVPPSPETAAKPYVPIDAISAKCMTGVEPRPGSDAQSSLVSFETDDILFGAMRPYFHKVALASFLGTTRSTVFVLRPHLVTDLSFALLLMSEDSTIDFATNSASGSTIPYAVWEGSLANMAIKLPSVDVRRAFHEVASPLLMNAQSSREQSRRLAAVRDILLPKVICGDLRIENASEKIAVA